MANDNGWNEYSKLVMKELERLNDEQETIGLDISKIKVDMASLATVKDVNCIKNDVAMLKVQAGIIGAFAGSVPAIISVVAVLLLG